MKKLILIFLFGACFWIANAQSTCWELMGNDKTTTRNFFGTKDSMSVIFKTNNTERMRLLSNSAFLGIGLSGTDPQAPLHLWQPSSIGQFTKLIQLSTNSSLQQYGLPLNDGFSIAFSSVKDIRLKQHEQANLFIEGTEGGLMIAPNGNIGMGTSSPAALLHLHKYLPITYSMPIDSSNTRTPGDKIFQLSTTITGSGQENGFNVSFAGYHIFFKQQMPGMFALEGPGGGLTIAPNGKIGVGNDTPQARFDVSGDIKAESAKIIGSNLSNGLHIAYDDTDVLLKQQEQGKFFIEGPGGGLTIAPDGKIGVGTDTPQEKLEVDGILKAQGAYLNSIGTKDCNHLIFKTQNKERIWLLRDKSFLGVGVSNPQASLHLHYQVDDMACNGIIEPPPQDEIDRIAGGVKLLQLTTSHTGNGANNGFVILSGSSKDVSLKQGEQGKLFLEGPGGGLAIAMDGNIGIGTDVPHQKLHIVNGNILISKTSTKEVPDAPGSTNGSILFGDDVTNTQNGKWGIEYLNSNQDGYGLNFWKCWNPGPEGELINYALFLADNGSVGVGKKDPQAKLDVNGAFKASSANIVDTLTANALSATSANIAGTVKAKAVTVTLAGWSDFVFENDYPLPSLSDVEQYIKQNNRLPDIPSAKEVEENGIDLGDMQSKLLQKVEELTLYILQQNKQITDLQNQMNQLKNTKP